MSAYTPPIKTPTNVSPGKIALALSLVLHIGATLVFSRNVAPSVPPAASQPVRPYLPQTYARHVEAAASEVKKLADVANALEKMTREQSPSADRAAGERAVKEAEAAQQAASAAQQDMKAAQTAAVVAGRSAQRSQAQATTRKVLAASERALTAQAKAFLAQDRVQQQLLRPTEKPTAPHALARTKIEHALQQQAAAQAALRQAQDALRQAARTQTSAQQQTAQARASTAMQQARAAQQVANQAQAQARQAVLEQVRVARYDRKQTPPPDTHPGGPKERFIIASTRVEEKTAQAIPAQEGVADKLKEARAALAQGDRTSAKKALQAAGELQKRVQAAQRTAQATLKSDGATIPGEGRAQRLALRQAATAQQAAQAAQRAAQKAVASGNAAQAENALSKAVSAQAKASAKQEATLASLKGAFGAVPALAKADPHHHHGPECFAPGGT